MTSNWIQSCLQISAFTCLVPRDKRRSSNLCSCHRSSTNDGSPPCLSLQSLYLWHTKYGVLKLIHRSGYQIVDCGMTLVSVPLKQLHQEQFSFVTVSVVGELHFKNQQTGCSGMVKLGKHGTCICKQVSNYSWLVTNHWLTSNLTLPIRNVVCFEASPHSCTRVIFADCGELKRTALVLVYVTLQSKDATTVNASCLDDWAILTYD